ncbi:MAG: class I SAM-dependent methyltransferase [Saprospiraceae bacterium]|nr:class I SAM-dependent methyltransferase [Saprospiraceae bacterium]
MLLTNIRNRIRHLFYPGSRRYWEQRYACGGDSGVGSGGELAAYKADILNTFVQQQQITSVVELGCGDGRQLQLAQYPRYIGLDIATSAVKRCKTMFSEDPGKAFEVYVPDQFVPDRFQAELAISLEVIFHLTEERLYRLYMQHLFQVSSRWVIIFSSDEAEKGRSMFPHFRQRHFSADVPEGWVLEQRIENPHRDRSVSDFFIFKKVGRV